MYYLNKDSKMALNWLWRAAHQGYSRAQFKLGEILELSSSSHANKREALRWYEAAADQGHSAAKESLHEWLFDLVFDQALIDVCARP